MKDKKRLNDTRINENRFGNDLTKEIINQYVGWIMEDLDVKPTFLRARIPEEWEITDMCNSITEHIDIPNDQSWSDLMDYCRNSLNRLFGVFE